MKSNTGSLWFLAGMATVIVGYVTLGAGNITIAPVLLVVGYCIFVPIALMKGFRGERGE